METSVQQTIQQLYGWENAVFLPVASGLINHTFKVEADGHIYILQEVNSQVFKHPEQIDENLNRLSDYLAKNALGYLFTAPVKTREGNSLVVLDGHFYRVFAWVPGSHTIDVVETPDEAFEAANQFGLFTSLLKGFDAGSLHITLPDFHNLSLRYRQFEEALQNGNPERIKASANEIALLKTQAGIVKRFESFVQNKEARKRVTHHDTKISNILFTNQQKGICVIDLDTVMPGFFLSDVGDMIRTYVCPVSEEEKELSKISIRKPFLEAIQKGYLATMNDALSQFEKDHFFFAGEMLIYMQALRFLADHLNNDIYYGSRYPGHNYIRAANQIRLLEALQACL
jgi:Ser/Thr protein kinase RdoA (MazF antagonist)